MEPEGDCSNEFQHGKYLQLSSCTLDISDDQLEKFLVINFKHLSLTRGVDQDEDVSLISWYTTKRFILAIHIFTDLNLTSLSCPTVLPYVLNVVSESSPRIPLAPAGFKGILYPPQASLIKRMLDIESSPIVFDLNGVKLKLLAGIVSERLSFGKTFCLPALICERFTPYFSEEQIEVILPINLIICGVKVTKEWKNNLKNFTSLDFKVIETMGNLNDLKKSVDEDRYPQVLVIKDGDITWNGKKDKALVHTLSLFSEGDPLRDIIFTRVIYDDYDMLKLSPKDSTNISSLFTWFISGTDSDTYLGKLQFDYIRNNDRLAMSLTQGKPVLDSVASVKCNREYSVVEYRIPQIDCYDVSSDEKHNTVDIITNIIKGKCVYPKTQYTDSSLFSGSIDVPYIHNGSNMKILVAVADKNRIGDIVKELNDVGIKSVKLTRANVAKFQREDAIICVSGNLFGVNMGFLTHIVINMDGFSQNDVTQIIGRGQRLSRKQNLQVYLNEEL